MNTAPANSPVGTYTIAASGAADADYAITYISGLLTITPAPLLITANNQTKVYGAPVPQLTASYSGLVNGDTPNSLTTPPSLATAATSTSLVGPYSIAASGEVDPDYLISYSPGSLVVVQDSTATAITASTDQADLGQSVTFTASVSASATRLGRTDGDGRLFRHHNQHRHDARWRATVGRHGHVQHCGFARRNRRDHRNL